MTNTFFRDSCKFICWLNKIVCNFFYLSFWILSSVIQIVSNQQENNKCVFISSWNKFVEELDLSTWEREDFEVPKN